MRNSDAILRLIEEMRTHEDALDRIRRELARLLRVSAPDEVVPPSEPRSTGTPDASIPTHKLDPNSIAARVVQALVVLGGEAPRGAIAAHMNHPAKAVGSTLNYLSSERMGAGRRLVETGQNGWRVTAEGRNALAAVGMLVEPRKAAHPSEGTVNGG